LVDRSARVFISYQRADGEFARRIREHLVAAGVHTWMDQFDIPVGAYWPDEIDKGLSSSDIVVGILSPDAVESRNVKNEWDWAIQNDKPLLLLQYRPCAVPHRYVSINFIDATAADLVLTLDTLLATLGSAGALPETATDATATPTHPTPQRHRSRSATRSKRVAPLVIGREREQAQLRELLDAMLAGQGSVVLLAGEAGIGKTTLTSWLAAEAEDRGALVVTGGCYDLSATPPYGPWLEIIRGWPDEVRTPRPPAAVLDRSALAALQGQAALFELVRDWLLDTAAVQPLMLLLEDLHWADQASLEFLRFLARSVPGSRLLLVATWRDDDLTRRHPLFDLLPMLTREAITTRLSLARLDPDAVRALISERYQLAPSDTQRVTDYVSRLTEGNPFFAGEVLRTLEENNVLTREGDRWRAGTLERMHVPPLVRNVIERRLAHIGDESRPLLEVAAVIGHEVPIDLWVEVSGTDEDTLAAFLEQAVAARMIEELRGGERFRFTHALIRETLYDGLVSLRRRNWHRKIAEVLEHTSNPDANVVAHHYQQANDKRAFQWLVEAGYRAFDTYAFTAAADRLEAAAALIEADAERRADHATLLVVVLLALRYTDLDRALRCGEDAVAELAAVGDFEWLMTARHLVGIQRTRTGNIRAGIELMLANARESDAYLRAGATRSNVEVSESIVYRALPWHWMDELRPLFPEVLRNDTGGYLGLWWGSTAHNLDTIGRVTEGYAMATQVAPFWPVDVIMSFVGFAAKNFLADTWHAIAATSWARGLPDDAWQAASTARTVYASFGHHRQLVVVHETELKIWLRYAPDQRDTLPPILLGLERETAAAKGARPLGLPDDFSLRSLRWHEGRWAELRASLDAFFALTEEVETQELKEAEAILAQMLAAQGDVDGAGSIIRTAFSDGPTTEPGDHFFYPAMVLIETAATLALTAGRLQEAGEWIAMYARWLEWSGSFVGRVELELLHACLLHLSGDLPAAEMTARQALALAREPRQPLMLVTAQRALGTLLTTTGALEEAHTLLQASVLLAKACASPYEHARSQLALAELYVARGADADDVEVVALLTDARSIGALLGVAALLERIATLEAGVAAASHPAGLETA
jgi:hypothetical protein